MSRTHRDTQRAHFRLWWEKWQEVLNHLRWNDWPRDTQVELDHIGEPWGSYYAKTFWRRQATRRDRHKIKDSLKHGGLGSYYRRTHGDGYWD